MASNRRPTVVVVYYSLYGNIQTMAKSVVNGLENAGVNAKLFQVAETLPQEILNKMNAPPKATDVPLITPDDLESADGILFGIPTRFGTVPAQIKIFLDSLGSLWSRRALVNKFAGTFFSTGSLSGGQETTALSILPFFANMGMSYVTFGCKSQLLSNNTEVHGGSAYGAGSIAMSADKSKLSELELQLAEKQGFDFGLVVKRSWHH